MQCYIALAKNTGHTVILQYNHIYKKSKKE